MFAVNSVVGIFVVFIVAGALGWCGVMRVSRCSRVWGLVVSICLLVCFDFSARLVDAVFRFCADYLW